MPPVLILAMRSKELYRPSKDRSVAQKGDVGPPRAEANYLKGDLLDQLRGWRSLKRPPMFFMKGRICAEFWKFVRHRPACGAGSNRPAHIRSVTQTEGHFAREPTAVHP
jgi:hypothetical protein